jgi:hypothetical protein
MHPMVKMILSVLSVLLLVVTASHAAILAGWTFETSTPGGGPGLSTTAASIGSISAETGNGTGSGVHASSSTVWSNPQGNGSPESFGADHWAVGDHFQFQTSSSGFGQIQIAWDQVSSGGGPRDFILKYSTDGSLFSQFGGVYTILENVSPNNWSSSPTRTSTHYSADLSTVTGLDNQGAIYFRLIANSTVSANGGIVGPTGASRVDNFTITAVPEPTEWALISCIGLSGICGVETWRRKRMRRNLAA